MSNQSLLDSIANLINSKFDEINFKFDNKFNEMNNKLDILTIDVDNKFNEMNNKFDILTIDVDNKFNEVNNKFNEMNNKLDLITIDVDNKFNEVNNKLDALNNKIDFVEVKLDSFRGEVNESIIRRTIQKKYGESYGEGFVIQGVFGFIGLLIPTKKSASSYQPRDIHDLKSFIHNKSINSSDFQIVDYNRTVLIDYIYSSKSSITCFNLFKNKIQFAVDETPTIFAFNAGSENFDEKEALRKSMISDLITQLATHNITINDPIIDNVDTPEEGSDKTAVINAFMKYLEFALLSRDEQMRALCSDSGIFMLLFCSALTTNLAGYTLQFPVIDLEIDCKGRVTMEETTKECFIEIGEIKSSIVGIKKAKRQLVLRLLAIHRACRLLYKEYKIILKGIIFLPISKDLFNQGKRSSTEQIQGVRIEIEYVQL